MYIKNFSRCAYSNGKEIRKFFGFSTLSAAFNNFMKELRRKAVNVSRVNQPGYTGIDYIWHLRGKSG
jgi:hypothetical protein